jgi:hypothetical protein
MPTEELDARYKKANDAVEKAMDARDDAIHALVEAEINYDEAIMAWGELDDEIAARDPAHVTDAALKRRRKMN